MTTYKYQNGLVREYAQQVVDSRRCCRQGLVEMEDGRVFYTHRGYNDTIAPYYEVLVCKKTGTRFNVNYNNGIAYRTNL